MKSFCQWLLTESELLLIERALDQAMRKSATDTYDGIASNILASVGEGVLKFSAEVTRNRDKWQKARCL